MGKLTNLKYPLKYTSTDFIAYTGELPDCIPSGTSSCEPMDRSLTKLFQLILEKYCEPSANPLDVDISEFDIECLIEANPDIEIGEGLTLTDLLTYFKDHLCYIYTRLCDICCDECGSPETMCEITTQSCTGEFTIQFTSNATYTFSGINGSTLTFRIVAIVEGEEYTLSEVTYLRTQPDVTFTRNTLLAALEENWVDNPYFSLSRTDHLLNVSLKTCVEGLVGFSMENLGLVLPDILDDIVVRYNDEIIDYVYEDSYLWGQELIPNPVEVEVTGTPCEFIQDHEDRITELENAPTPTSEPYVPEPLVIPIYRVLNQAVKRDLTLNIHPYFKYKTPEFYFSKTEDGARLDSLTQNSQTSLGVYGKLWLDSDTHFMRYEHTGNAFPFQEDNFELYLTDGSGSNYIIPITVTTLNACCDEVPPASGEGFLYDYIIEFNVTGWNTEGQFEDAIASVDRDPTGGLQTATPQSSFVLRLNHNLGIIGTYTAVPVYLDGVGGAISTSGYNTDYVDIQLVNNPFNILGTNIRIKVTIYQ